MALLGGHAAQRIATRFPSPALQSLILLPLIAGLGYAAWFTREINLVHYDDNQNQQGYFADLGRSYNLNPLTNEQVGYVYAQTDRDFLNLVQLIGSEAAAAGGKRTIFIAAPEYWPLPWYLRQYSVDFTGKTPDFDAAGEPVIDHQMVIANTDQLHAFSLSSQFKISPTSYTMRPGVSLILLARQPDHHQESESKP